MSEKARKIIEENLYLNLATVTPEGHPWNTPVYFAYDEEFTLYWASWRENQHSQNIQHNPQVFITIYDSTQPEGTGEGVYIQAKAYELTEQQEIARALEYYYGRKDQTAASPDKFLGDHPRRVYKAVPEKFWMNGEGEVDGHYVDTREDVTL